MQLLEMAHNLPAGYTSSRKNPYQINQQSPVKGRRLVPALDDSRIYRISAFH